MGRTLMLDAASRGRGTRRGAALTAGLILGSILIISSVQPRAADAMCCNCSSCGGAAFCVDALPSSLACANFCVAAGCNSTVFDAVDHSDPHANQHALVDSHSHADGHADRHCIAYCHQ